jgi:hypothetical protein
MTTEQIFARLHDLGVTPEQAAAGVRAAAASATPSNVHVIDQSGQPYGSERRCCNRCGAMATPGMWTTPSLDAWNRLPEAQRCKP